MGKAARLKVELEDVSSLLEILTVLKDVSSNRYFVYAATKVNYQKLMDIFYDFFELLEGAITNFPLMRNSHPGLDIVVLTSEQGFMSQLNGRVSSAAFEEYSKSSDARLICIGQKGAEKCRSMGMAIEKTFLMPSDGDRNEIASDIRHYLIDRVRTGQTGKVVVAYVWAKGLGVLKSQILTLLPLHAVTEEHMKHSPRSAREMDSKFDKKNLIVETPIEDIVESLVTVWVHARLYELINDLQIVEAAAKATQLESSIEGLTGEKKKVILNFRKAGREELNAAMRGVVTSTNMTKSKARAKAKQVQSS